MKGDFQVRFREKFEVKFLLLTRLRGRGFNKSPPTRFRKQIDYKSTEKRGKWSLNRNNRKNEKIKKKQLTRGMKGAIIAKSLVRQSISTKKTKKSLKKVLDKYKMI